MRVVWITHNYPRHAGDVAGAFLHPLAVALRQQGVDLRVVAPSDAGQGGDAELDGVPVRRVRYGTAADEQLAYRGTMMDALRSPRAAFAFNRLRAALRTGAEQELAGANGNAVVHAHWWVPSGLAAPTGAPLVLTCHGTDVRLLERIPLAGWLARPTFHRARVVTTVSRTLAAIIRRRTGVCVEDDAVQPMPVTLTERPWSDGSGDVVVVGRLTEQKRVHLAIDAAVIAKRRGSAWRLMIVGDGPARLALERRAVESGVGDAIRFVGALAPADVPVVFATAACCIMPAKGEGFGLAAAEALMQGVPVVACLDGGGLCEFVPSSGAGRVVAPAAEAIAGAVAELLGDTAAPDAARTQGTQWRERLAPSFVAQRCLTWYQRALNA
jgi:glycosyltransferase involved in cell wall biosynthesis